MKFKQNITKWIGSKVYSNISKMVLMPHSLINAYCYCINKFVKIYLSLAVKFATVTDYLGSQATSPVGDDVDAKNAEI